MPQPMHSKAVTVTRQSVDAEPYSLAERLIAGLKGKTSFEIFKDLLQLPREEIEAIVLPGDPRFKDRMLGVELPAIVVGAAVKAHMYAHGELKENDPYLKRLAEEVNTTSHVPQKVGIHIRQLTDQEIEAQREEAEAEARGEH